ncbi:MAG: ComEC/Rec2 family competence protein [Bacteroidota bacterium]
MADTYLALRKVPFIRIVLTFISGILFRIHFEKVTPSLSVIVLLFIIFITLSYVPSLDKSFRYRWVFGTIILMMFFYAGVILTHFTYTTNNYTHYICHENSILCIAESLPDEKDNSYELTVRVTCIKQDSQWVKTSGKLLVYFEKDSRAKMLNTGDQILFKSRLQRITNSGNPNEFDYSGYMRCQKIYASTYVPKDEWIKTCSNKGNILVNWSGSIRKKYIAILQEHKIPENEFAIATALIVGHKNGLTPGLKDSYASAGAMHLLAISGLHVGVIYVILNSILLFFSKIKHGAVFKTIIIIAVLTGMSSSVVRAVTMFSILSIGNTFKRDVNVYNTLSISAFFILLFNPLLIQDVGFQLSYIAVISIVFFYPKIYSLISLNNPMLQKIWSLAAVSIAAQIAVFPVVMYYFHQFPVCFLFTNIFAIPLVTIAIYLGVLLFIVSPFDIVASGLVDIFTWNIRLLNNIIGFIHNIPFSTIHSISIDEIQIILLYFMIMLLTGYLIIINAKYLLAFLMCVILFLTRCIIQDIEISTQKRFYVYNIPGVSACDILKHKQNMLFYNVRSVKEKKMLQAFLSDHWIKHKISIPFMITHQHLMKEETSVYHPFTGKLKGNVYVRLPDKTNIVLLHKDFDKFESPEKLKAKYVIIGKGIDPAIDKICNIIDFNQLVLDSSVPYYSLKKWKHQCEQKNIDYYSVSEKGAFMYDY